MPRAAVIGAAILPALLLVPAVEAGQPPASDPAPAPRAPVRIHLGLRVGAFEPINSADSYDAVFGDPMPQLGLQLEAVFRGRWLLALAIDRGEVDGERVLLTEPPRGTGVPVTLIMTPVHLTAGALLRPAARGSAYLGVGPTLLAWEEGGPGESRSASDYGAHALIGGRWALGARGSGRWALAAEVRYSSIPDAIGEGGVSEVFGEDDLGGLAAQLLALYRLR